MMGYNDLKDPSVSGFFRFLARVGSMIGENGQIQVPYDSQDVFLPFAVTYCKPTERSKAA